MNAVIIATILSLPVHSRIECSIDVRGETSCPNMLPVEVRIVFAFPEQPLAEIMAFLRKREPGAIKIFVSSLMYLHSFTVKLFLDDKFRATHCFHRFLDSLRGPLT